ncbi:MAG: hypothetical protein IT385_30140 [Deltaproteobacteria bacterium]|nr:hypothetical protein [Deltaproteobacteria bacterium]
MRLALTLVSLASLVVAACSSPPKATPEAATKACVRHIELGFWKGFEASLVDKGVALDDATRAEGKARLTEVIASDEGKAQIAKCVDGYTKLATMAQVECISAAATTEAAAACVK